MTERDNKPHWVDLDERHDGCYLICHRCKAEPKNLGNPHITEVLVACRDHALCKAQPHKRGMVRMKGVKNDKRRSR